MKASAQFFKTGSANRANATEQLSHRPTNILVNNRPQAIAQRKLQEVACSRNVMQRVEKPTSALVVVDDQMDVANFLTAAKTYFKLLKRHSNNVKMVTTSKAQTIPKQEREKVYLVAHGSEVLFGGRMKAEQLGESVENWGIKESSSIKLLSCNSGDGGKNSFASTFACRLDNKYQITGIKGAQVVDEEGHNRGRELFKSFNQDLYDTILSNDSEFQSAFIYVKEFREKLDSCEPSQFNKLIEDTFGKVNSLVQAADKKLAVCFSGHSKDLTKEESRQIIEIEKRGNIDLDDDCF